MSEPKPTAPQPDELARRLQQALARRRPRPWKLVMATLIASTLSLLLLAWWLYPRARTEVLQVVAFDGLITVEETPRVRAQLLLPAGEENQRRLRGQTLVFHEPPALKPGVEVREIKTGSDDHGAASVEWFVAPPPAILTEFGVRYNDIAQQKGSNDVGRLYVWPKDAPLLIVDADETLLADPLDEKAANKLQEAAAEGWRIVYLAVASTQGQDFRGVRGKIWQTRLPTGPVIGRPRFPSETSTQEARREVLQDLQSRFRGKFAAVVKSAAAARLSKDLGMDTITMGEEVAGALHVPGWDDVVVRLK